jgi:hypothetical protein
MIETENTNSSHKVHWVRLDEKGLPRPEYNKPVIVTNSVKWDKAYLSDESE